MISTQSPAASSRSTLTFEDSLADEVSTALRNTGYAELGQLDVIVDQHDVLLRGTVSSFFLRQKAECVILNNPAVGTFHSEIDVQATRRHGN